MYVFDKLLNILYEICVIGLDLLYIVMLLLVVAYFTLLERKCMASVQRRTGPRVVGFFGVLQPLADGLKLLNKEFIIPVYGHRVLFLIAPAITLVIAFIPWIFVVFDVWRVVADFRYTILGVYGIMSLSVYGLLFAGWSSNSKYAFLGAIRSGAQVISYELVLGFLVLSVCVVSGSFNFSEVLVFQHKGSNFFFLLLPLLIVFLVVMLAETNRAPFDLAEAEAEIVAGYNVEYASIIFAMFFLGEYMSMFFMSYLCSLFFLNGVFGSYSFFLVFFGALFFSFFFILVRAALPRFRYDQLMVICWQSLLPFVFGYFIFLLSLVV